MIMMIYLGGWRDSPSLVQKQIILLSQVTSFLFSTEFMVLIVDGHSEIGAHVISVI